ncbi:GNAT family N-acetyltransferase [Natronosalvus vescus]|uniref:GNAT family N-acetyltransferase n=1 Tax=Natronosalvus vescus TaxID=2953881 RepID=UPI002090327F|nr:GNAT family N-acetyltransferase [Natronosalvus vescus]
MGDIHHIRPATPGDAAAIRSVARASWHAAYDDFLGRETVDAVTDDWYAVDRLRDSIEAAESHLFVCDLADADWGSDRSVNDVAGFVHVSPWAGESGVGHLKRLYVHPDHWGQGLGTALLERGERALEQAGYDRIRLEVFAENGDGVGFYEARGYGGVDEECETLGGETRHLLILEMGLE